MNRYETYKDSGIPWLGDVPEHWEVKRLKFLARIQNGADYKHVETNDGYPVIGSGGQFAYANSYLYDGESVLLGRKGTIDKPLYVNSKFWTVDTMYYTEILKNTYPKYLYYLTLTIDFGKYSTQTALPSMTQTALNNLVFAVPHYKEQTAIAHYLDTKLGEIDALIGKQQTLLEKLAEQRTAVITHAVTKGLNPAAPMKKSGVEWLGDVPAHWDIKHSNQIFKIHNGATPKTSEPDYWGDEIVWFTPKDLGDNQNKEISTSLKMITKEGYENCGVSLAPAKSIVLSKRAPIGHLAITLLPAVVNQGCFLLEVLAPNDVNYLYYWLYANKTTLNSFGQGSTFMELPREKFAMLKISTPPKDEQTSIAEYLDQETAKIDRLCETVNQTIGRLKEYRTALITQAVTGKIKVTDE